MNDPLGLIGNQGRVPAPTAPAGGRVAPPGTEKPEGPSFGSFLRDQLDQVNQLDQDAKAAAEDLAAGRRDDPESVILATQKADLAFKMLLQVRNRMMAAYDEIKDVRI